MKRFTLSVLALCSLAGAASAAATLEWLPDGIAPSSLSYDGSVVAGNVIGDYSYETYRWTSATGVVRLGQSTYDTIGVAAGVPKVSYDGTRISGTILSSDDFATQGIWDINTGWQETMPPAPANGGIMDLSYGSAWGLSGNGLMVTGFYWTNTGRAQSSTWTSTAGMVALPQLANHNARVNAASYDGSVVVGWEEHSNGPWQPRVWRNGVKYNIFDSDAFTSAESVNGDGSIVVGQIWDPVFNLRVAAIWYWNGTSYTLTNLGYLPGTIIGRGQALLTGVSNNGKIAVGFDQFRDTSPLTAGAIWTPATGLVYATDYLASIGIAFPEDQMLLEMDAVSPDGSTLAGMSQDIDGYLHPFLVHLTPPCTVDVNSDGHVNTLDLGIVLSHFGSSVVPGMNGDTNGDGVVNTLDLGAILSAFGSNCP